MIDEKVIEGLRVYLKENYIPPEMPLLSETVDYCFLCECELAKPLLLKSVSDDATRYIENHRKPGGFAYALEEKRKEKGLKPSELYKKANIDRRHYSRLMGPEGRHPSKNTVISFALALRLERGDFDELLQSAGYALSNSSTQDVCIMYCLENSIYNIDEVNALLFAIGIQPLSRE